MRRFAKIALITVLCLSLYAAFLWYVENHDVPHFGDSHVAFTMEDGRGENGTTGWTKDFYAKDWHVEWHDINFARIVNPSPQRCVLVLTNTETEQTFKVRYREILSGNHYTVVRQDLDGEVISSHELTIHH